jgi:uncharacterized protein (TIGR03435 family)
MISVSFFIEFALRAALIATGTAVVLTALRIRTASARHAAWTAVVLAMLALPITLAGGVRLFVPVLRPSPATAGVTIGHANTAPIAPPDSGVAIRPETASLAMGVATETAPPREPSLNWQAVVISIYVSGVLVFLIRLAVGTIQANRLRAAAIVREGRLTSARCVTPITVGWFAPALILPEGWDRWSSAKLSAVLTHEREHGRRHDPLVQWLALLNRAVFWFHPVAWWLDRHLSTLAEEACDAAVLAAGHSPQEYSEYLLEMARSVSKDGGRLQVVGMAMPGAGLPHRVRLIFQGLPATHLSRTRIVCTIAFCATSSALFAAGTPATRAAVQLSLSTSTDAGAASPAVVRNPVSQETAPTPVAMRSARPQQASAATGMQIKFEVVSIRPCETSGPTSGRGGGTSMRNAISPGYATWGCVTLSELIDQAFGGGPFPKNSLLNTIRVPPGQRLDTPSRIRGGPSWVENEHYAIEIRLTGDTTSLTGSARHNAVLTAMAPALQAMLEDRFQLKLRKATEERRMYALTVKPGFAMTVSAPEKCWKPEDYPRPPGLSRMELPPPPPGWEGIPACGYRASGGRRSGNESLQFEHITLADFAKWLSEEMDRYVLDRTSTPGRYSFRLEFAPDESTPGIIDSNRRFRQAGAELLGRTPPDPVKGDGPTIFKALENLGLSLANTTGPAEYFVIDSVQRPKRNKP